MGHDLATEQHNMCQALHKTEKGEGTAVVPASKVLYSKKGLRFLNPSLAQMQILQKRESAVLEYEQREIAEGQCDAQTG